MQAWYAKKFKEGFSPTTVLSFHKLLHLALDKAVEWSLVSRNICDVVSPPRVKRYEIQPLTAEQIQRLLRAARGHRLEALFVLALATGMRRGELLALKWQDIHVPTGTLQVRRILTHVPAKLNGKGGYVEADLRHSSATMLLSIGIHPKAVQEFPGHSQIGMTMDVYSHVLPTQKLSRCSAHVSKQRKNNPQQHTEKTTYDRSFH